MQVNWFTVIAQIINFLILVWLLKRYLYKPILNAVDEREKKITSQLRDAEAKKNEAEEEQVEFRKKNETFDAQKKEMMNKVVAETNEERQKLLEAARNDANILSSKLDEALKEMQQNRNHEIAEKIKQEVITVARKTLIELASMNLEEQSVNVFIGQLKELKEDEKKKFIAAFKSGSNSILVRSAYDLSSKLQTEIEQTVNNILETKSQFQFLIAPELISGIEVTANGYKLAWSISEYLKSLEKNITDVIKDSPKTKIEEK